MTIGKSSFVERTRPLGNFSREVELAAQINLGLIKLL
jgi:hypothetical protein